MVEKIAFAIKLLFLNNSVKRFGISLFCMVMLSKYVPAQHLQIEFLNTWRNTNKYPAGDVLPPEKYSFDYLFAIAMFAQPLALFEISNLPPEAFKTAALIKTYKQRWTNIHKGQIFPIGNEPDGFNWSGFQSVLNDRSGYILIFRDNYLLPDDLLKTNITPNKIIHLQHLAGSGKSFSQKSGADGHLKFSLPHAKSFALHDYKIN